MNTGHVMVVLAERREGQPGSPRAMAWNQERMSWLFMFTGEGEGGREGGRGG